MDLLNVSPLCHNFVYEPLTIIKGQGCFPHSYNRILCCLYCDGKKQILGRYGASLEAVPLLSKPSNCGHATCSVTGVLESYICRGLMVLDKLSAVYFPLDVSCNL